MKPNVFQAVLFYCVICLLSPLLLFSIQDETLLVGHPRINNYFPEDYNASSQNWAAVEDLQGLLYVANNNGVLEFDGSNWRLLRIGDDLSARSLAVDDQNRIFIGAFGDFGFFALDEKSNLTFTSLGIGRGMNSDEIGDVITTVIRGDEVIFLSSIGLFVFDGHKVAVIRPQTRFHLGFVVKDQVFVRQRELGLFILSGTELVLIEGSEIFANDRVYAMFPHDPEGSIMLASQDGGFFSYEADRPPAERFRSKQNFEKWRQVFSKKKVSVADRLANGSIALATTQDGLYLISPQGRLILHLNRGNGLPDDVVYYVYRDKLDNLVLCLSRGISYLETGVPIRFINEHSGLNGIGNAAFRLPADPQEEKAGRIVLGTYQGLFAGDEARKEAMTFQEVAESGETWQILHWHGQVLVVDGSGVSVFRENELVRFLQKPISLSISEIPGNYDSLLVGAIDGLTRIFFQGDQWYSAGTVEGLNVPVFNLCFSADGDFWSHTFSSGGLFRFRLDSKLKKVAQVRIYGRQDGLPSNSGNIPYAGKNRMFFATRKGVYHFIPDQNRFEPDPLFPETQAVEQGVLIVHEQENGDVWVLGNLFSGVYRKRADGGYDFQSGLYSRLKFFRVTGFFDVWQNGLAILGFKDGFITFPVDMPQTRIEDDYFKCLIRGVEYPGGVLHSGSNHQITLDRSKTQLSADIPVLPFRMNNIRFTFASPLRESPDQTDFSYILRGFDTRWSKWTKQKQSSYTNLKAGKYHFLVRARNCYGQVSAPADFIFQVLPPWYQTFWAFSGFSILALLLLFALIKLYNRKLIREKTRLEMLVADRTRELREMSLSDPLTGLRNRRFVSELILPEIESFLSFKRFLVHNKEKRFRTIRGLVFGIFIFDLDHFKQVNDLYGHDAGDRILKQVAGIMRQSVRKDDYIVRWGGEEFVVILKKTDPEYLFEFSEKIRKLIAAQSFSISESGDQCIKMTISAGVVPLPVYADRPEIISFENTIILADLALYQAKMKGRNRVVSLCAGKKVPLEHELDRMLNSLEYALENDFIEFAG